MHVHPTYTAMPELYDHMHIHTYTKPSTVTCTSLLQSLQREELGPIGSLTQSSVLLMYVPVLTMAILLHSGVGDAPKLP